MDSKPSREQFEDYVAIRDSGVTNMFSIPTVCNLSTTGLTYKNCIYIMDHFTDLAAEYQIEI